MADFIHVLVSARCDRCGRDVAAPIGEITTTGVFGCTCGSLTRAATAMPDHRAMFSGPGWHSQAGYRGE